MDILNERTEETKKNLHLLCTTLCGRNCPNCCNKLYSFDSIPYATKEELSECENVFLTGGEPFAFAQPNAIAGWLKNRYPNIKKVYVYTNASELFYYLCSEGTMHNIDGVSVSIKTHHDRDQFEYLANTAHNLYRFGKNDRCYYFGDDLKPNCEEAVADGLTLIKREWKSLEEWKPASDSFFRKI